MIDWHSHILPNMDDGSRDLGESIEMLTALQQQGVDTVIATPHFHVNEESVEEFLSRRQNAFDLLCSHWNDQDMTLLCGAEVRYYPGISRLESLEKLVIGGTNLLLLEMPMAKWTDHTVNELTELANMSGFRIVMAHIERYIAFQDKQVIERLLENGILMQSNASFFDRIGGRNKAIKLLARGYIHFIGTDCHNMKTRPPKIASAYELIRKKLGDEFASRMLDYGYGVLGYKTKL